MSLFDLFIIFGIIGIFSIIGSGRRGHGENILPPLGKRPPPPKGQGYPVITVKVERDRR